MVRCIINRISSARSRCGLLPAVLLLALCLLVGTPAVKAEAAGVAFEPMVDIDTYLGNCTAAGDFDGDGDIDLLVGGDSILSLFKNVKNGELDELPRVDFQTGKGVCEIWPGDLDRDGDLDAVLVTNITKEVIVMTNNGKAEFTAQNLSLGRVPLQPYIGDLNQDGQQDIIVNYGNGIEVFYGPDRLAAFPYENVLSGAAALGDLNGDGKDEVAIGSNTLEILSSSKNGKTLYNVSKGIDGRLTSLAIADYNGDGKNDIAATNANNNKLNVFLNSGDAKDPFVKSTQYEYASFGQPNKVYTADLDGDWVPDIITIDTTGSISVFLNKGDGSFDEDRRYDFGIGGPATDIATGDFNSDGMVDLAAVGNGRLGIFINNTTSWKVEFEKASYNVSEESGSATVNVTRGNGRGELKVDYATSDKTALAGEDYTPASGTLTFEDGVTSRLFKVSLIDNDLKEAGESFTVSLKNPGNGFRIGKQRTVEVFIADNDDQKTAAPTPPVVEQPRFTDIGDHWAKDDILFLADKGVVSGVTPTSFQPERAISRAEVATLLGKALGLKEVTPGNATFEDVPQGTWYFGAVEAASQAGLVSGVGEGRFEPNRTITRQELAALAVKARGKLVVGTDKLTPEEIDHLLAGVIDAGNISPWAREGVARAIKLGIIKVWPSEGFNPAGDATRAMSASAIAKVLR
ncbi:MAG: hypothetical protein HPY50_08005 [Firmicutes bacterium]|nr:hypothetical protein [Bacillota bacterium]